MELFASHCAFPTPDIEKTAEYYRQMLGFRRVDYLDAEEKHICLYRDGVEFILTQANGQTVTLKRRLHMTNTGRVSKDQEMKNYAKLLRERMMKK